MGRRAEPPPDEALGEPAPGEEAGPAPPFTGIRRRRLAEAPAHERVEFLRPAPVVRRQGVLGEFRVETGGGEVPADAQGAVSPRERPTHERLGATRIGLQARLGESVEHVVERAERLAAETTPELRAEFPAAVLPPRQQADAGLPEVRGIRRAVGTARDQ